MKRSLMNEEIEAQEVRLIDADGEQAGIASIDEALKQAQTAGLDLVEISPDAEPPVCKIMDYGKKLFEVKILFGSYFSSGSPPHPSAIPVPH